MSKTYKYVIDFDAKTSKINKGIGGMNSMLKQAAGAAAALFSIQKVAEFGAEIVKLGGEAQGVRAAFDRMADQKTLDRLREATKGTVNDLNLMKRTIMAAQFGIPIENLASLLEFATKRAQETGQSVDYLVDSIVTGIGRKSPLILDNLGISAVALKEKLKGVGTETASVADIAKAVGDIAAESMAESGDIIDTNAVKMQNIKAQWDNFKLSLAENKTIIESVGDSLTKTQQMIAVWTSDYATTLEKWAMAFEIFDKRAERIYNQVKNREEIQKGASEAIDAYSQMIEQAKLGIDQLLQSENKNNTVTEKQVTTYGDLIAKIAEKNDLLKQADITDTAYITTLYAQIAALEQQKKAFEALAVVKKITPRVEGMDQLGTIGDARVEGGIDLDASRLDDMTPFLEQQLAYVESLRTGWASFGEQFDMVMERMAEGGERITGAHILAADMMSNLMGLAYRGADSMKEWAAGVKDAAMSSINAFIAEGVAGAVSKSLSSVPFPLNMVLGAAAAAAATGLFNSVIPKFELGGVVPGTSFYGDKMLARVNSGEEILRRDDPRHRNNYGEPAGKGRDRLIIPNLKLRKGDIYVAFQEAEREILKRT